MRVIVGLAILAGLVNAALPAVAQEVTAEVRTWDGKSWRLTQPRFEVFYTIMVKPEEGAVPQGPKAPDVTMTGSVQGLGILFKEEAQTKRGHAQVALVTISRKGVETEIPLASIRSLQFFRQPVEDSALRPYLAVTHFRYSAAAVLLDGSRVEGDYVNLGTAVLRGMTPQGQVDIPWQEIGDINFGPAEGPKTSEGRGTALPTVLEAAEMAEAVKAEIAPRQAVFLLDDAEVVSQQESEKP